MSARVCEDGGGGANDDGSLDGGEGDAGDKDARLILDGAPNGSRIYSSCDVRRMEVLR